MIKLKYIPFLLLSLLLWSCEQFEEFNANPNEPTQVSADVLLPNAIRTSVNASVEASFLVGNNAAQLTAKTLRLEVDAYNWNAFPTYWENFYTALTDVSTLENLAIESGNTNMEGAAIITRSWIFSILTNAYGDIPYFNAIEGAENNFTPAYDNQQDIYQDILSELDRADDLLADGSGIIGGDILLGGDPSLWRKFGNSLRLRLLMNANQQISDAGSQFASIANEGNIMSSNADNAVLRYTGAFPNAFPLIPIKQGDFDAVALSEASLASMQRTQDPRLLRYARPNNEDFTENPTFLGAINGQGENCTKAGASRLGVQYFNYPNLTPASSLGLPIADGLVMTYPEVEFLLAEAAAMGWINDDIETHYRAGIEASMDYYMVDYAPFGYTDFEDFYTNSGAAYSEVKDIWEQKWLALFFNGLQPYFEVRRWYIAEGAGFESIPFLDATCGNLNDDRLPIRFLYPGQEQSLNNANYQAVIGQFGDYSQNSPMWLVQ